MKKTVILNFNAPLMSIIIILSVLLHGKFVDMAKTPPITVAKTVQYKKLQSSVHSSGLKVNEREGNTSILEEYAEENKRHGLVVLGSLGILMLGAILMVTGSVLKSKIEYLSPQRE